MNEIRQVAIYCRVSTEEQATEGYSISAQLQTLRQYAQLYGWEITGEYVDEGISGKNISGRPAIQKLIADVDKNKFQAVLVWKISRLSRNMLDTLTLLDLFEDNGVKFISYSENFDTGSPIGRLVVQLMASIAEMERNTLSENVKLGMKQRALEGSWNGGIIFGYDVIEKELVINEKEASIIRLAFELYAEGKGLKAIANHLNKAGYRTKRGHHFSINGVAQILDNIVYNGKISWAKVENWDSKRRKSRNPNPIIVEGKHESIISDDLWNIVQARRNSKSFKQRQSNKPFLLSGLLRCPTCNQGMVPATTTCTLKGGTKRKYRYYVCSDFHNKGASACSANSTKAYEAEAQLINKIEQFAHNEEQLFTKLQALNTTSIELLHSLTMELEVIKKRLLEIQSLQNQYLDAFEQKTLPVTILHERLQKLSSEKTALEQRQNEITAQLSSNDSKVIQPELIQTLLMRFLEVYKYASREHQKRLLQLLIERITIAQPKGKPRSIDIVELNFDFSEVNVSKTFTLLHLLYREADRENECTSSISAYDHKMPPYLQLFLPLFMVRFTFYNSKAAINLLNQHKLHELMRQCHFAKRLLFVGAFEYVVVQSE